MMMASLESSISDYTAQLSAISAAVEADPGNAELTQLQAELQQLIDLTQQSLLEQKKAELLSQVDLFDEKDEDELNGLESDLAQLEGVKVSAPHTTKVGSVEYHNAIIFCVEGEAETAGVIDGVLVRVVFSHPTEQSMLPCQYYLSGKCRFPDSECKWSHGEVVSLSSLREFVEPDYNKVVEGVSVLARGEGRLVWGRAEVEAVEDDKVYIKFNTVGSQTICVAPEDVLPLTGNDDQDEEDFSCDKFDTDDDFAPTVISDIPGGGRLGDWEVHTRGIASKLMAGMGWVPGSGLGSRGEGKVEPVPAMVYPQGKSLDWCMELREKAGGGDMLTVEKTIKKRAKIEEKRSQKQYEAGLKRDEREKSLFNFINSKLGGRRGNIGDLVKCNAVNKESKNGFVKCKGQLKKETVKNLKVQNFKLHEEMSKKEKELHKLREGYERLKVKDPKTAQSIKLKIEDKEKDLHKLSLYERNLNAEQGSRQNNKKLSIF